MTHQTPALKHFKQLTEDLLSTMEVKTYWSEEVGKCCLFCHAAFEVKNGLNEHRPDCKYGKALEAFEFASVRYEPNPGNFEEWLKQVDEHLRNKIGMTTHDIDDALWMDMFEEGQSPEEAADEFYSSHWDDSEEGFDEMAMSEFFKDDEEEDFTDPDDEIVDFDDTFGL